MLLLLPSVGYGGEIDKKTRDEGRLVKSWEMDAGEARELWKAAAEGNVERVQSLLESGADICEGNDEGLTPLMMAAQNGHAEVVRALLRAGAPWNALNPAGKCAGDFAMEAGHQEAFDVLLDAGKLNSTGNRIRLQTWGDFGSSTRDCWNGTRKWVLRI